MPASNLGVGGQQSREFPLAQQSRELSAMGCSPRSSPMFEEDARVGLDREPTIGRGHRPVATNANLFRDEGFLVGLVSNVFDDRVRDDEVERISGERQVPAVRDDEVVPGDRVLWPPIKVVKENAARNEELNFLGQPIGDDVLEGLVLTGLDTHNKNTACPDRSHHLFKTLRFPIPIEDAKAARRSRNYVAHNGSLWQALVAKPLGIVAFAAACLLTVACSPVNSQEAARSLPAPTELAADDIAQPAPTAPAPTESAAGESLPLDADAGITDERGGRQLAAEPTSEQGRDPAPGSETEAPVSADPVAPTTPATPAQTAESDPEPLPQAQDVPVATTAPIATTAPVAPLPTPTRQRTIVIQPMADPGPEPAIAAPAERVPVPSDDIVIEGPTIDESEPVAISDAGASTCALTEGAIDFLDRGDTARMTAALEQAAQLAGQTAEPEIAQMAADLGAVGANEDAAVAVIIATLGACAIHGYQV